MGLMGWRLDTGRKLGGSWSHLSLIVKDGSNSGLRGWILKVLESKINRTWFLGVRVELGKVREGKGLEGNPSF
jgi:hypothetical protein